MKEHIIQNISHSRFEFETLSKRKVLDVFQYNCRSLQIIKEEDLQIIDDKLCLPIDLSKWIDFESNISFLSVLNALKKITNPKSGTPLTMIAAKVVGYDNDQQMSFTFTGEFVNGKHAVVGQYENGDRLLYTDKLYIID